MSEPEKLNLPPPGGDPDPLVMALRELKPAAVAVNRDGLMYAAGAESRRGVVRLWQAAAGFLAAVGFAAGTYLRPAPPEKIVYVERPAEVAPASALPSPEPTLPEPTPAPLVHRSPAPTPYARAWLQFQSDVLNMSLSLLPDTIPDKP